ncbi:hypothetical protein [Planctomicrobium piriforme]|uniref:Uncharacterized protein n=1 Tax=Planctomicrobium piriforme TaxID=1576369 RepID=A0A1I3MJT3_9PLAN|nr:hypothetical protein [Planctomicrobium piriforme]SFI97171.1 hypothetical protein SAMN05421753_11427 [Planctomicrobium piriforme]
MCRDAVDEDLVRSRPRWYDLPAYCFFHRPIRCRMCEQRYYTLRTSKRAAVFPYLWMHYALLLMIVATAIFVYRQKYHPHSGIDTGFAKERPPASLNAI